MELDKKQLRLLRKSVDHWMKDIVERMERGDVIYNTTWRWKNGDLVPIDGRYCPLCKEYHDSMTGECCSCPYPLYYGSKCDNRCNGYWNRFALDPTVENAYLMVGSLMAIIHSHKCRDRRW